MGVHDFSIKSHNVGDREPMVVSLIGGGRMRGGPCFDPLFHAFIFNWIQLGTVHFWPQAAQGHI